jgi:hypothetical protein
MAVIPCDCKIPDFLIDPVGGNLLDFPQNQPPPFAVLIPWVKIAINGDIDNPNAQVITVGNESQGGQTAYAAIKSFQYGSSDGFTVKFEIVDVQGGNFCSFVNKLAQDLKEDNFDEDHKIIFRWGWSGDECGSNGEGSLASIDARLISGSHTAIIRHIVPVLENGMFRFTITCVDPSDIYHEQVVDAEVPEIPLVHAITTLFVAYAVPSVDSVIYQMRDAKGNIVSMPDEPDRPFFASNNGINEQTLGPKVKWNTLGRTPLSILRDWLGVVESINGQGFKVMFESGAKGINLIIRENDKPGCEKFPQIPDIDPLEKRVYIVNGGVQSKVLSFTPNIKWIYVPSLKAGAVQDKNQQKDVKQDDQKLEDCQDGDKPKNTKPGITTMQSPSHPIDDSRGSDAMVDRMRADRKQFLAENAFEAITAELRIQGDPSYQYIQDIGQLITVVVINSFIPSGTTTTCDWTIQTMSSSSNLALCNSVLSNKSWMIKSFFHDIKEGSYTTTLELVLAQPGIDTDINNGIGD